MTYLDALQATLAGEHAAVYVLGYLGGQAQRTGQERLMRRVAASYDRHRTRRDVWVELITAEGAQPVASDPGYAVDDVDGDAVLIERAAARIERRCGDLYGYLVANTDAGQRQVPLDALLDAARQEVAFGAKPRPLPGR